MKKGKGEKELEAPTKHLLEIIEYAHFLSHIHKVCATGCRCISIFLAVSPPSLACSIH